MSAPPEDLSRREAGEILPSGGFLRQEAEKSLPPGAFPRREMENCLSPGRFTLEEAEINPSPVGFPRQEAEKPLPEGIFPRREMEKRLSTGSILRREAEKSLPPGAFLRRDRGEALYVTDAPRRGVWQVPPGFRSEESGGLARLFPLPEWMERIEREEDDLASRLTRFRGSCPENVPLFISCVKALEKPDAAETRRCGKELRQRAALALRCAARGEGLYGCALVLAEAERNLRKG